MSKEKYYLYIDDSGSRYPDKEQATREDGMDYFALGGILIKEKDRAVVLGGYEALCRKWEITYPLHSTDIRGRRGNFVWLGDESKEKEFLEDLMTFLCNIPVIGFAAVVDRVGYNNRYEAKYAGKPWWMCKTAFCILLERVSKYVAATDLRFKIRFEQCGPKEDRAILEYFRDLRKSGTPFNLETASKYGEQGPEIFQQIPYGDPERRTKKSPLLQIADLYLYPMVKGGYDKTYKPYRLLMDSGRLIDSFLTPEETESRGIKYSCFGDR